MTTITKQNVEAVLVNLNAIQHATKNGGSKDGN